MTLESTSRALQQSRFHSRTLRRIESKRRDRPNPHRAISGIIPRIAHIIKAANGQPSRRVPRPIIRCPCSRRQCSVPVSPVPEARWPEAAKAPPFLISMSEIRLDGVPTPREMELRPTRDRPGSRAMPDSTSPDFGAAPGPSRAENSTMTCSILRPRANARGVAAVPDLEAREPASRPIWLHVMQNGPGKCARSGAATKWPRRNLNLPLAARARVGHIRRNGAVAEWLKAAVC